MIDQQDFPRILEAPKNTTEKWKFDSIKLGEHVVAPKTGRGAQPSVIGAIRAHGKSRGRKFTIKQDVEFVHIWRTQ